MLRKLAALLAAVALTPAAAADGTWDGSASNLWHTADNWTPSGVPDGAASFFNATPQMNVDVNLPAVLGTLRFQAPNYSLSGQRISLLTLEVLAGASGTSIANEIHLVDGGIFTFDINHNLALGTVSCGGDCSGALNKIGPAVLSIANPTLQGDVIVQDGTLTLSPSSGNNALGIIAPASVNTGPASWNSLSGTGTLALTGTTTFESGVFQGNIASAGPLVKSGPNALTLLGNNGWTGGTTITGGTLAIGNIAGGTFPSGPVTNNGVLLQVGIPGSGTVTALSGAGNLEINAGTINFVGPGPWNTSGNIGIFGGALNAASMAVVGSVTVQSPGVLSVGGNLGSLAGNGTVSIDGPSLNVGFSNADTTFSGGLSGAGQLFKFGTGTLTLSGSFTGTQPIIVVEGTLKSDGTGSPSTNVQVLGGATLAGSGQVVNDIAVTNGGTLVPGSPALAADSVALEGKLQIAISGSAVGQYGRLQANQIDLHATTSSLELTGSYVPVAGDVFVIVDNPSGTPQTSTFPGLPEGATISFNGVSLQLTYAHLGGNDIALSVVTHTVTATGGANGTITPASRQVDHGATTTFTVTPNAGYVAQASGCGGTLAGSTFTTGPITGPCTVTATFTALVTYNVVLEGWQQVSPYVVTPASGSGTATFNPVTKQLTLNLPYSGLTGTETAAHIHGPAGRGANAGVLHTLANGSPKADTVTLTGAQETMLANGELYVNIHTSPNYPNGEIRGQIDNAGARSLRTVTVTRSGTGSGTVTGTTEAGQVIDCGNDCSEVVTLGMPVVLTAVPDPGSRLFSWSHCTSGTSCQVVPLTDATVDVRFEPLPTRLSNISTRAHVLTGNDVVIGGFILGSATNVVVRARGPSLVPFGIANALVNPVLQLVRSSDQATIATNDDWQSAPNAGDVVASGFAPSEPAESAILMTLGPGAYTAILSGVGNATGVGIVEVFEVDAPNAAVQNISTRAFVQTGNDVMIGGFVIDGTSPQLVVVRARGPSLAPFGIANALSNPRLQLVRASDQAEVAANDDWQSAANSADLEARGLQPSDALEAAILITLQPGAYTAIVTGTAGGTGVGIVEVFKLAN